jgi:hypothetical protein
MKTKLLAVIGLFLGLLVQGAESTNLWPVRTTLVLGTNKTEVVSTNRDSLVEGILLEGAKLTQFAPSNSTVIVIAIAANGEKGVAKVTDPVEAVAFADSFGTVPEVRERTADKVDLAAFGPQANTERYVPAKDAPAQAYVPRQPQAVRPEYVRAIPTHRVWVTPQSAFSHRYYYPGGRYAVGSGVHVGAHVSAGVVSYGGGYGPRVLRPVWGNRYYEFQRKHRWYTYDRICPPRR